MYKRKIGIILSLILVVSVCFAVALTGCKKKGDPTPDSSDISGSGSESVSETVTVTLNAKSLELSKYETAVLVATASDGSAALFSSDNETVATVTNDGVVTAKNVGACDIVASVGEANA